MSENKFDGITLINSSIENSKINNNNETDICIELDDTNALVMKVKEIQRQQSIIDIDKNVDICDEIIRPLFENEMLKLEVKTDLKALKTFVSIKPEINSFLIKIQQLTDYIKTTLGDEKITATNIIIISTNLMHIVEQYKDLTGSQKKMLILDTIKKVINQNVDDVQERMMLMMIVNMTLPSVLDTLVTAINGDIKFEKTKVISIFKKIFCCQ